MTWVPTSYIRHSDKSLPSSVAPVERAQIPSAPPASFLAQPQNPPLCSFLLCACPAMPAPVHATCPSHPEPEMSQVRGEAATAAAHPEQGRQDGHLRSWRLAVVVASLCCGILLLGLDMNIVGVAVPRITTDFGSLGDIAWYGSAYLLAITAFQPLFGNLYKFFHAKAVYLVSLLLFEGTESNRKPAHFHSHVTHPCLTKTKTLLVGSVICAAAPCSAVLIFGRAFLGFGAAGLLQGALAIIGLSVQLDKIPLYQGIVVSSLGISVCLGPILGGVLTDHASWRKLAASFHSLSPIVLVTKLTESQDGAFGCMVPKFPEERVFQPCLTDIVPETCPSACVSSWWSSSSFASASPPTRPTGSWICVRS